MNKRKILPIIEEIEGFKTPLYVCEHTNKTKLYVVEQSEFDNELGKELIACMPLPYLESQTEIIYKFQKDRPVTYLLKNTLHSLLLT